MIDSETFLLNLGKGPTMKPDGWTTTDNLRDGRTMFLVFVMLFDVNILVPNAVNGHAHDKRGRCSHDENEWIRGWITEKGFLDTVVFVDFL